MSQRLRHNLALIGPPGSGKGTYGKYLSQALAVPLVTVSDVLRQHLPSLDLTSGQLVDDDVVNDAIHSHVRPMRGGYIMDGFPRTIAQVQAMETSWKLSRRIHSAILLDVPDFVCRAKTLGRRVCRLCGGNYNVAGVNSLGFDLPPNLPAGDRCCPENGGGEPNVDWIIRDDDVEDIVQKRLRIYHEHADPIISHFESKGQLLRLVPYKGHAEVEQLVSTVQEWVSARSAEGVGVDAAHARL